MIDKHSIIFITAISSTKFALNYNPYYQRKVNGMYNEGVFMRSFS